MCSRIKCRKCGAESYAAGDTGLVCIRCYNLLEADRAKLVENNDLLHEYIEQNRITQLELPCPDEETNRRIEELKLKIKDGVRRIRRLRSMREQ